MNKIAPLEKLSEEGYGRVICYPKCDEEELDRRLTEMRQLGVKTLCFTGKKNVNNTSVLGKGCVGIVILAQADCGKVALKIRRTDAGRAEMKREADMLRIANSVDVGPKLLGFTENFLIMEFIDGPFLSVWVETLEEKEDTKLRVRRVLRDILEQCWRLDVAGLDHGELSRAPKHIIVDAEDKACILDFETASNTRKASNVTKICQYLFMRGKTAELINRKNEEINKENLLVSLKTYKKNSTREEFEAILKSSLV